MNIKNQIWPIVSILSGLLALACFLNAYLLGLISYFMAIGIASAIYTLIRHKSKLATVGLVLNGIALLLFFSIAVLINKAENKSAHTIYAYYLPKNFTGWVKIKTNVKNADKLKVVKEGEFTIYKIIIPEDGNLITSTSINETHVAKYFRYSISDTSEFNHEIGKWGDKSYKTWIHCETGNGVNDSRFYVPEKPLNPQDPFILEKWENPAE